MKPLVYVSGPITRDPFGCVRESMPAFRWLLDLGCVPFMPQWTVIAEMVEHLPYEDWLRFDLDMIERCDAVIRLPGESPGADREVAYAGEHDIPVWEWCDEGRESIKAWFVSGWAEPTEATA